MTTSISLRIQLLGILRENCELPIMFPARQFREKCRKREITGDKQRFRHYTDDRPNYVSSQPRYDHFDISAYSIIRNFAGKLRTAHQVACMRVPWKMQETGDTGRKTKISQPHLWPTELCFDPDRIHHPGYHDIISHLRGFCKPFLIFFGGMSDFCWNGYPGGTWRGRGDRKFRRENEQFPSFLLYIEHSGRKCGEECTDRAETGLADTGICEQFGMDMIDKTRKKCYNVSV